MDEVFEISITFAQAIKCYLLYLQRKTNYLIDITDGNIKR
ncbi:hypothetical protein HMPREF9446_03450 [Bacteroides fluxus YIT 12057]|jgi:hypothetical protein|uniref:Uncharacterized protein n=1 Tax=Bacteroides fluxus YIT 12057 TaxID=763034 RepID=F3PXF3_9BACE|nr:hypothetical protein HMPREF9446_03450 [Bacteroides fluxus YIT 12057]